MPASTPIVLAIRRAADLLGYSLVLTDGGSYRIVSGDPVVAFGARMYSPPRVLAVLAEQCMMPVRIGGLGLTPEELAERIQWSGPVPRRGVSPHQEAVLERVASAAGAGVPS